MYGCAGRGQATEPMREVEEEAPIQQLTFCFRRRHSVHEVAYLVFP